MIFRGPGDELLDALDAAFAEPYRDFAFERGEPIERGPHATGFDVRLTYQSRAWATLRLEVSGAEGRDEEVELVPAIGLASVRLTGPTEVACLPLRFQVAQKVHAVTERPDGRENRRFRDLVDLLLVRDLVGDLRAVRAACEATFALRATHPWPPVLDVPDDSWHDGYTRLARELNLEVVDVEVATHEVQAFITAVADAQ